MAWRPGSPNRSFGLGRLPAGTQNKTEAAYSTHLETRRLAGEIQWAAFEVITIKIAADCRYTPDFVVLNAQNEFEFHEVKGFMTDDSLVKIKVAARNFPARFFLIFARKKKDGGGWDIREIEP